MSQWQALWWDADTKFVIPGMGSKGVFALKAQLPCPHHPSQWVQSPSSCWAGGLAPFSVSLTRAMLLPLLFSYKGQARRACCVRVSVARGSLTSFPPSSRKGHT